MNRVRRGRGAQPNIDWRAGMWAGVVAGVVFMLLEMTVVRLFGEPLHRITQLETHISWVFLTGVYAYKIKKPLALGFLDFSSLQARRHYCDEELRLNRRLAPELYVDMAEIRGPAAAPRIGGTGVLELIGIALERRDMRSK